MLSGNNLEGAFANYRVWESFGFSLGLFLTRFTTIAQFLIVLFTVLLIGISGYAGVEFYEDILASIYAFNVLLKYAASD